MILTELKLLSDNIILDLPGEKIIFWERFLKHMNMEYGDVIQNNQDQERESLAWFYSSNKAMSIFRCVRNYDG